MFTERVENPAALMPVKRAHVVVGKPLPFHIYDPEGNLLMSAGQTIQSQRQLDSMMTRGVMYNPNPAPPPRKWQQTSAQEVIDRAKAAPSKKAELDDGPGIRTILTVRKRKVQEDPTETGALLKMNLDGQSEFFMTRLIGTIGSSVFIISPPESDVAMVPVYTGQIWEFRAFYGLSVFRFVAKVAEVITYPTPMLIMHWPESSDVETRAVRSTRRVMCEIPTTIRRKRTVNEDPLRGAITNLSCGGIELSVFGTKTLDKDEHVVVSFMVGGAERKALIEADAKVVVYKGHGEFEDESIYGLAFLGLLDRDFFAIHSFVCDRLISRFESPLYASR